MSDEIISDVIKAISEQNIKDQESPSITNLKSEIKEMEKKIDRLLDQMESADGSNKLGARLRKREDDLQELNRKLTLEQSKQRSIDPVLVYQFLCDLRDAKIEGVQYDRLLIGTMVDKLYLYDDRFSL